MSRYNSGGNSNFGGNNNYGNSNNNNFNSNNNGNNANNGNNNNGSAIRSLEVTHKTTVILRCKVIILGDACVGKSALTQVFESGGSTYPKNYLMVGDLCHIVADVLISD
jgi:hypothetical protein